MHAIGQAAHPLVQVVDFLVARVQAPLQIEDARHARKVDALVGELVNKPEPLDVGLRVHAGVAARSLRRDEAFLLVRAQRLGMHSRKLRCHANHVQGSVAVVHYHVLTSSLVAA